MPLTTLCVSMHSLGDFGDWIRIYVWYDFGGLHLYSSPTQVRSYCDLLWTCCYTMYLLLGAHLTCHGFLILCHIWGK